MAHWRIGIIISHAVKLAIDHQPLHQITQSFINFDLIRLI